MLQRKAIRRTVQVSAASILGRGENEGQIARGLVYGDGKMLPPPPLAAQIAPCCRWFERDAEVVWKLGPRVKVVGAIRNFDSVEGNSR